MHAHDPHHADDAHGPSTMLGAGGGAETAEPGHEPARTHHDVHLHDAPPAMAFALIVLALGSVLAGYVGIPHALGGHNNFGTFLEPSFAMTNCGPKNEPPELAGMTVGDCVTPTDVARASLETSSASAAAGLSSMTLAAGQPPAQGEQPAHTEAAADEEHKNQIELSLMAVSSVVALLGIALATWLWLKRPDIPAAVAARSGGLYRLLLNKYYVDEVYDATIVQPIKIVSEEGLWRGMDARVVDGAVNGTGQLVAGTSAILRLFQNGSVKAYAASTFVGVVAILAYYIWR
jgi:NADH-quinone oxidoreductase subunit L